LNKLTIIVLLLSLNTSACSLLYVPDIQQGNVITDEMLSKLKTGMDARQVKFVLGSPLIQDPFHKNRWDYFYSYKNNADGSFKKSLVSVVFKDGKMVDFSVDPKRPEQKTGNNSPDNKVTIEPEIHDKIGPSPD